MPAAAIALLSLASVFVEPVESSTVAASFRAMLAEDLPLAKTATEAQVIVRVAQDQRVLRVEARARSGEVLVERSIELAGGLTPALRVAVLLAREAIDIEAQLPAELAPPPATAPPPLPPPAEPRKLRVGPIFTVHGWARPPTPQLGLGVSAELDLAGGFSAGASAIFAGWLCCERETADVIGDVRELIFTLDGVYRLFESGAFFAGVTISAGADVLTGDARAVVFQGPGTPARVSGTLALAAAALDFGFELDPRLLLRARLGGRAVLNARTISVPGAFPRPEGAPAEPLDTGNFSPYASLGAAFVF